MASVSSQPAPPVLPAGISFPGRVRFTRAEYRRMAEAGVLAADARVELLNGEVVAMSPIGPFHAGIVDDLADFFSSWSKGRFRCRVQGPQAASDNSEPEPDLQLLRKRADRYRTRHPSPADVLLVVEVAESSLATDLGPKMRLYAAAGIVEYWVVDLVSRRLVVHRGADCEGATYRSVTEHVAPASVAPQAADDCALDLGWLFGEG